MSLARGLAIELLRRLLEKKMPIQEVVSKWPRQKDDQILERVRCLLDHYLDDEDIRKKDKRYVTWEENQIYSYIRDLQKESM